MSPKYVGFHNSKWTFYVLYNQDRIPFESSLLKMILGQTFHNNGFTFFSHRRFSVPNMSGWGNWVRQYSTLCYYGSRILWPYYLIYLHTSRRGSQLQKTAQEIQVDLYAKVILIFSPI